MPATGGTRHAGQAGHRRHHSELRPRRAAAAVPYGWPGSCLPVAAALPGAIPWPENATPKAAPLAVAPAETDDLSRFHGYDAVVVTWTAAEASALAALFTPEHPTATWYEYRHNIASYIPLVTGVKAPFISRQSDMARYYHNLGLYFPCTIGSARVLLFKSGLHLDYDGPATPVRRLMSESPRRWRRRYSSRPAPVAASEAMSAWATW
jgi:hypothetical protein